MIRYSKKIKNKRRDTPLFYQLVDFYMATDTQFLPVVASKTKIEFTQRNQNGEAWYLSRNK